MSNISQSDGGPADGPRPDPAAAPSWPDATTPPDATGRQPVPPSYSPGYASLPRPPDPQYPPTAAFPSVHPAAGPVNYAPPGHAPDYGPGAGQPGYPAWNLAPSDYPGGYPPVPPGPPGYGVPPAPAPRRSNAPLVAVIVAVALLLCGGIATAGIMVARNVAGKAREAIGPLADPTPPVTVPDRPTQMPNLPGLPTPTTGLGGQTIKVTYEITGDGPAEILYVDELGSAPKRLDNVSLPWKLTTSMQTPALVSVTAMRVDTTEGRISCRALVDGAEVKKSTSAAGNVATASCTYFALD